MAAAYAALVSLTHIIHQIEHHPRPPLSLHKQQVDSLTKNLNFLQQFLETYSSHVGYTEEAQRLETRIADAAHAAQDVIESHIVDRILDQTNSADFHRRLDDAIERMDSIKEDAIEIKEKLGRSGSTSITAGSSRSAYTEQRLITVGIDDALYELLDKLTGGNPDCRIISIVGMGGIGKSTLARKVVENQFIAYHFDILAWITVSQEYSIRALLELLLVKISMVTDWESLNRMSEDELGEIVYRCLWRGRYMIVMDDVWDVEVLNQLKFFFPNNRNGSRIMLTTRLSNLISGLSNCCMHEVKFLDGDASWDLLCESVFGERNCPLELEELGKRIAKNCSGLPLSIVAIGGLLAKSEPTRVYWEYISKDLSSIVNSEDDERCLKILHLSYRQLPVYLKPCLLYMAMFPEDSLVRVSMLSKLLVGEGFLKPISGKSYEEVAEGYVKELIDPEFFKLRLTLKN